MNAANLSVRVDADLKKEVEECLSEMGMNMSTAINIYLKQILRLRAIPFSITANSQPNQKTLSAMKEAIELAQDPNARRFHTVDELAEDWSK